LPEAKELAEQLFAVTPLDQMIAIYPDKQTGWFDLLMSTRTTSAGISPEIWNCTKGLRI
jgi:hypothetical protein